jgi:hypothetical protein
LARENGVLILVAEVDPVLWPVQARCRVTRYRG